MFSAKTIVFSHLPSLISIAWVVPLPSNSDKTYINKKVTISGQGDNPKYHVAHEKTNNHLPPPPPKKKPFKTPKHSFREVRELDWFLGRVPFFGEEIIVVKTLRNCLFFVK